MRGMSETSASGMSETSATDLSSYSSDGRHLMHVVPCARKVPHVPKENRSKTRPSGLRPAEMGRRKDFVDCGLRESAVSRANPPDTHERQRIRAKELAAIHGTIDLRSDDDSLELFEETLPSPTLSSVDVKGLFDQRDELNQEIQAKCNVKRSGEWLNMESRNLVPAHLVKLNSMD